MSARLERRGRQLSKLTLASPIGSCVAMSALGPKRTFLFAPQISAFGGKADMARTCPPRKFSAGDDFESVTQCCPRSLAASSSLTFGLSNPPFCDGQHSKYAFL